MTADDISSPNISNPDVEIRLDFNSHDYDTKVMESGDPDHVLEVGICVDGSFILGSESGGVGGWPCSFLFSLVDSVEAVSKGSNFIVEFGYGPCWLGLHPQGSTVRLIGASLLSGAKDPDKRLETDVVASTTTLAWSQGVLAAGREYYDHLVSLEGSLAKTDHLQLLDERLTELEQRPEKYQDREGNRSE